MSPATILQMPNCIKLQDATCKFYLFPWSCSCFFQCLWICFVFDRNPAVFSIKTGYKTKGGKVTVQLLAIIKSLKNPDSGFKTRRIFNLSCWECAFFFTPIDPGFIFLLSSEECTLLCGVRAILYSFQVSYWSDGAAARTHITAPRSLFDISFRDQRLYFASDWHFGGACVNMWILRHFIHSWRSFPLPLSEVKAYWHFGVGLWIQKP